MPSLADAQRLYELPLMELVWQAASVHRQHFDPNQVQASSLLSIKTGACPEDCKYCPQSAHYQTGLSKERLMAVDKVLAQAEAAKASGATRFCMGAAWSSPHERDMPAVLAMVREVKAMGMETCMTLGMLQASQAQALAEAGLDYYNHNLDSSREFYPQIISTRSYDDRLDTLANVRAAGIKVCSGGILGMGESVEDRLKLLLELANLDPAPESVPINKLVAVAGTPLAEQPELDDFEFVRIIAVARLLMPSSHLRLSAGRESMSSATQALCFLAGANSIFYGDRLLTTDNPQWQADQALMAKLGIQFTGQSALPAEAIPQACPKRQAPVLTEEPSSLFYSA